MKLSGFDNIFVALFVLVIEAPLEIFAYLVEERLAGHLEQLDMIDCTLVNNLKSHSIHVLRLAELPVDIIEHGVIALHREFMNILVRIDLVFVVIFNILTLSFEIIIGLFDQVFSVEVLRSIKAFQLAALSIFLLRLIGLSFLLRLRTHESRSRRLVLIHMIVDLFVDILDQIKVAVDVLTRCLLIDRLW